MASRHTEQHWQVGKSLKECNLHMLEHDVYSDVTFVLKYKHAEEREEPVYVTALRTLLIARSPVFEAMFRGDLAQQAERPIIDIHDIEPQAFKEMLRFIYSDEVRLTADNILSILYAAKKYIVTQLTDKCLHFLEKNVSTDTALQLLEQTMIYGETDLKKKVLNTIQEEASTVLASEELKKLSKEALDEVLRLNLRITNELEVFSACIKWAENKCKDLRKIVEGENLREVLGDSFFLIRFPTMTLDHFNESVAPQNVLTDKEGFQILRYITSKSGKPDNLPFSTEPRSHPKLRLDLNPRFLLSPGPYKSVPVQVEYGTWTSTDLNCTASRSFKLKTILVHCPDDTGNHTLSLSLTQDGQKLHHYKGNHPVTPAAGNVPRHWAVAANDVIVKAGEFQLNISLYGRGHGWFHFPTTPRSISPLSDDYVSITCPPNDQNLLLGIEYTYACTITDHTHLTFLDIQRTVSSRDVMFAD